MNANRIRAIHQWRLSMVRFSRIFQLGLLLVLHVIGILPNLVVSLETTANVEECTVNAADGTCLTPASSDGEISSSSFSNSNRPRHAKDVPTIGRKQRQRQLYATTHQRRTATTEINSNAAVPLDKSGEGLPPLPQIVSDQVQLEYGLDQTVSGSKEDTAMTYNTLVEMHQYMYGTVLSADSTLPPSIREECRLRHAECTYWASLGECQANPKFMTIQCAPACQSCHMLEFETRCPMPHNASSMNIWKGSGHLNAMFERIIADPRYEVTVLSRSGDSHPSVGEAPWVIQLDNFLTPVECQQLIDLGTARGYEQSQDVGAMNFDGTYGGSTNDGRTSTNTWCLDECYDDPVTKVVLQKLEQLTGIPDANSEYLQLLRYDVGQYYQTHHDYIGYHIRRAQGPRILTAFLYLNTVSAGGGTNFPDLDLTVEAVQGRALLWPSVMDRDPSRKDGRTDHQALPVFEGIKYGANAWFHLRDFKTPFAENCI